MASSKPLVNLSLPLVTYSPRLANLAHNCNIRSPAILASIGKAIGVVEKLTHEHQDGMRENKILPLRKYPIQLDYADTISANDIEYWNNHLLIVDHDNICQRVVIPTVVKDPKTKEMITVDVPLPFIFIHTHSAKPKAGSRPLLNETVKKVQHFSLVMEQQHPGFKMFDVPNSHDVTDVLVKEIAIVLDHEKISNDFVNIFYETLYARAPDDQKEKVFNAKERTLNDFRGYIERICEFCVFKICKNPYSDGVDMPRVCYIDGTCVLTSNPLLAVFFLISFGLRSFANNNSFTPKWTFAAISNCINTMYKREKANPIQSYFKFIRSPPLKGIPKRFVIENWRFGVNPTYTTLNRCNEIINFETLYANKGQGVINESIQRSWYQLVFYKLVNDAEEMFLHENFNGLFETECFDPSTQRTPRIQKQKTPVMYIMAFEWHNVLDTSSIQITVSLRDDEVIEPIETKIVPPVVDDPPVVELKELPSPPIKKEIVETPTKKQRTPAASPVENVQKEMLPSFNQPVISKAMMDVFLAQIRSIVKEEITIMKAEVVESLQAQLVESREKTSLAIRQAFPDVEIEKGPNMIEKLVMQRLTAPNRNAKRIVRNHKVILDTTDESEIDLESSDESEEGEEENEESSDEDNSDEETHERLEEYYQKYVCSEMTIRSNMIHSAHPLSIVDQPVLIVSTSDLFLAQDIPAFGKGIKYDDKLPPQELKYVRFKYLQDVIRCRMATKCVTGELDEFVSPVGPIGYRINVDFINHKAFLDPVWPELLDKPNYDLESLNALLGLRRIIFDNDKDRKFVLSEIVDHAQNYRAIADSIQEFEIEHHESIICEHCYDGEATFIDRSKKRMKKVAQSNNDVMFLTAYQDIKKNAPPRIDDRMFDHTMEACMQCYNGFHWQDRKGRKPYILLTDQFDHLKELTKTICFKDPKIYAGFPVLLEIALITDEPDGVVFCSDVCKREFAKETKRLESFIKKEEKTKGDRLKIKK
jgi:hypothetical protein